MQSPNIRKAKVLKDYLINIVFDNGEEKIFDIQPYLQYPIFQPLKEKEQLYSFSIVDETIEWECGADLSPDTFYIESKSVKSEVM